MKTLPFTALATMLALAACNGTPQTTDNAAVNTADAADLDNFASHEAPVIEDATEAAAVVLPAVPKPAAGASPAEAAPLADATEIEAAIREGRGIQRIRHGEGWAWMHDGKILRTADRDGKNVAYFRGGADKPFFVQRGDRSFAYQGDKPVREFDRDGRARTPDADQTREATEAAREARDQRTRADRARETAGRPGEREHGPASDRVSASPSPTPAPSPSPTARGGRDRGDRPGWSRPSPQPSESARPQRDRNS